MKTMLQLGMKKVKLFNAIEFMGCTSDPFVAMMEDTNFREENDGRFAAFSNGALVATSDDRAALFARIRKKHPGESFLVVKVAEQARVVRFRRPRRMIKASHAWV